MLFQTGQNPRIRIPSRDIIKSNPRFLAGSVQFGGYYASMYHKNF